MSPRRNITIVLYAVLSGQILISIFYSKLILVLFSTLITFFTFVTCMRVYAENPQNLEAEMATTLDGDAIVIQIDVPVTANGIRLYSDPI